MIADPLPPPRRVGLVVDHPLRDLDGALLVAIALARQGMETALIPQYEQGLDAPMLGLDAILLNYARPVNLPLAEGFAAQGLAVFVLDTEGGVLADDGPSTPERLAEYIARTPWQSILSGYFFWGPRMHEAFRAISGIANERLFLTGCPRFDVAAPGQQWRISGRWRDHILVNTNFPAVNPRFATGSDEGAMRSVGYDADYVAQLIADTKGIMAGMIETVRDLAQRLPSQRIVVRPHPFERAETYIDSFADFANVIVDGDGDVFSAMKDAAALVHLNCGTAIEAVLMAVPPLSVEFLNTKHMSRHASLPSRVSIAVTDQEHLAVLAAKPSDVCHDFGGVHAAFIAPYFHVNDGLAAERVASVLARATKRRAQSLDLAAAARSSRVSPRPIQRVMGLTATLIGSRLVSMAREALVPTRRGKRLDLTLVRKRLSRLEGEAQRTRVDRARHPVSGVPLASLIVRAQGGVR